ncbi:hypothetical protein B5K08_17495 [Rhizobium leguminosarum bv. trifolii]|uniref:Uncharacterized protein n=1 Tax=Rhizobium leguminosarum bv. trifolii TaxID=386 RepID=A0A3E1BFE5_RHILT|nr:hypothetical protein [Rhizobium leguminosarum]RFB90734.1 hypothetical protein B5K08_17495 [Rhizobium leguminosarum bv. trifolii]RFB91107.1 hypothetical protein B5K10_17490 [Rhizobium leguminosarum bv. trifolii]
MAIVNTRILILCKTYPSPSGKYAETTCVAGMDESGKLIRLFPVPFRLIAKDQQFKKWQWINAKVEKAKKDHRPESFTIKVDTIDGGEVVLPGKDWAERRRLLSPIKVYRDFDDIEAARQATNQSLALLKPTRILGLEIEPVSDPEWTEEELAKLVQEQKQGGLFDDDDKPSIKTLRKLPFDFYYRYECGDGATANTFRHKLVDWEVGALYWNCHHSHRADWERHFRDQLENKIPEKDLMLLMGNQHRFQDQWLIISLIYPPHQMQTELAF